MRVSNRIILPSELQPTRRAVSRRIAGGSSIYSRPLPEANRLIRYANYAGREDNLDVCLA